MKSRGGAASARDPPRTMHPRACPVAQMRQEASKRRPEIGEAAQVPEPTSGGGGFEPAERRRRLSGASALESLSRKGLRRSQAVAAAPQNDPKKPGITPQNRDRSRSRGAGRPTPPGGIVPAAMRALVAALLLSTASLVGAQTHLAPDGTWVGGGTPQLAPNGTWVGGRPELA